MNVVSKGKIIVSKRYGNKEERSELIDLEIQKFETEPAYVRAAYGVTKNLGNFESARCDAAVTLPCYVEELSDAFERAWEIAEEQVQKQIQELE